MSLLFLILIFFSSFAKTADYSVEVTVDADLTQYPEYRHRLLYAVLCTHDAISNKNCNVNRGINLYTVHQAYVSDIDYYESVFPTKNLRYEYAFMPENTTHSPNHPENASWFQPNARFLKTKRFKTRFFIPSCDDERCLIGKAIKLFVVNIPSQSFLKVSGCPAFVHELEDKDIQNTWHKLELKSDYNYCKTIDYLPDRSPLETYTETKTVTEIETETQTSTESFTETVTNTTTETISLSFNMFYSLLLIAIAIVM